MSAAALGLIYLVVVPCTVFFIVYLGSNAAGSQKPTAPPVETFEKKTTEGK